MCSAFFVPLSFSHYIVCLSFFCIRLLITPLLPSNFLSFVSKWSSSVYGFWLPLCYLQTFCPSWVSKWYSSVYGFWLPLCYLQTFCPSWVSKWLMFNTNWASCQLYFGVNKLYCDEIMLISACTRPSRLVVFFIMKAHWNNCPQLDMTLQLTHYPYFKPTSLCSYSLLFRA